MDTHPSWGDIEHQETDIELTVPVSDALRLRAELPGLDPIPTRVCTGHLDRLIVPETARFLGRARAARPGRAHGARRAYGGFRAARPTGIRIVRVRRRGACSWTAIRKQTRRRSQ